MAKKSMTLKDKFVFFIKKGTRLLHLAP